jgi:hypothetical protein
MDTLLDIAVLLPTMLSRADRVAQEAPSVARGLKAKDLLDNCLSVEKQFEIWYHVAQQVAADESTLLLYWIEETPVSAAHMAFPGAFSFASPFWCMVHVQYWSLLLSFRQCIQGILETILDSFAGSNETVIPTSYSDLLPGEDVAKYQIGGFTELAGNVCRGLDFALQNTYRADMIAAPFLVVNEFYQRMRAFGDTELECMWCDDFKGRIELKGYETCGWIQGLSWVDLGPLAGARRTDSW